MEACALEDEDPELGRRSIGFIANEGRFVLVLLFGSQGGKGYGGGPEACSCSSNG
jgi:hypothetical protein